MRLVRSVLLGVALISFVGVRPAVAQPLADRIPSDALFYAGWAGADKLAPAYAQSHLKGLVDSSNMAELFSELGPRVVRRIQLEQMLEGDPVAKELLPALLSLGEAAWHSPTALYVGPLDYAGKVPMPKVAFLCQAGKDAQTLADTATKLLADIPPDAPIKIRAQVLPGDLLVISNFEFAARIEETLAHREQFKSAIKQGLPDAALTVFFDTEKVLNVASLAINMAADAKAKTLWQKALLTTGMAGIKRVVYTAGFDGKDWGSQAFIDVPQPRMGLLASLLEPQPVSDDTFKLAPKSSNWVAATRFDLAKLVGEIRRGVSMMEPDASRGIEGMIGEINKTLGFDLQKDLLASLGDQWLAFNSDATGHGVLGMTVVSAARDAGKLESSLSKLEQMANQLMAREAEDGGPTFAIATAKIDDLTVHYFAVPAVSPCWAIKDGKLYLALFPQILVAAADQSANAAGGSVLTNADFNAARKRLGVEGTANSLMYMDLPRLAPRGYQMVLAAQRTALGFADMFGMQTPAIVIPPLNKIMPHLSASASATWSDDLGWHYRGVSPFPGADALGGEQALIVTAAPVAVAVALPATARARQSAMMVQNMNNLRQIGMGAIMYANDNNGDLPPDLGATFRYVQSPNAFMVANHVPAVPPPANGKLEDLAKWVNEQSDFVYLGKDYGKLFKIPNTAQAILAYEKFETSKNGLVGVLFADGHVEQWPIPLAKDRIEQQKKPAGAAQ